MTEPTSLPNAPVKQSALKRVTLKFFSLLNSFRKIIINVVFFLVLFLFIAALGSDDDKIVVPNNTALVLNLTGDIVEQKNAIDPMDALISEALEEKEKNPEVLLSDLLNVIERAKNDSRIEMIVLQLQGLNSTGLSKLQDIAQALETFKAAGKKIIAVGDQYSQDQYYLASSADEVWLNPRGWLLLDGYGRYQLYFKSALDKLSISQHIFRVGTYKSAVEPYMRDDMSAAAKEANKLWLTDLWSQYKSDVASNRKFSIDNFDENADVLVAKLEQADGNIAQYALDNLWVDALKNRQEMKLSLIKLVGKNSAGDSYNNISFKHYLSATKPLYPMVNPNTDKVAVIVAKGTILDGRQKPGTIGGDSTASLLREARLNNKVKAVVLRVDSPGGSAYASEIIRQEIELIKLAGKPVVASMGTYAASGGYWISAPADKIIASPATITGSIGIYGFFMTFENSLSKLGVYTDGVGTTDIAGFGVTRPLTDGMARVFQLNINRGYQDFIGLVAENRNMSLEQVDSIAQGRVWSGAKAKELGLVDELGNLTTAINAAAELAELATFETLLIEIEQTPKDLFLQGLLGQAKTFFPETEIMTLSNTDKLFLEMKAQLSHLNILNDPQGVYSLCMTCEIN
ncbi:MULTISPECIES: signal peptide peptidase SppA [unclassified Colwellia]|jgi:protease-4|uniref:signal peptide peptidase SppA n=1 Tax=unclassified Colwellia TaxID=196834 RepID=UPI0015F5025B|nr:MULTISPECIES: signal peptide peptidase SppA [unclassified Colwellia]MBA6363961.1 signal peptide peptidase SppA [Colwellia sp. BRX8-8]MBA6338573.1 signal peptide peptidase SppA [Colwellia sp. BRX8-7]MBA6355721.1 signal peptide peptidase SppA [Colwellia sp. BRX8-3]MBA6359915.1 signal peptide peptidase SppA [Colwellia sp. BRX8-6]MBA6367128.1 signal peptide peptidase SppA [Colwellia sp. BRX8-5]